MLYILWYKYLLFFAFIATIFDTFSVFGSLFASCKWLITSDAYFWKFHNPTIEYFFLRLHDIYYILKCTNQDFFISFWKAYRSSSVKDHVWWRVLVLNVRFLAVWRADTWVSITNISPFEDNNGEPSGFVITYLIIYSINK